MVEDGVRERPGQDAAGHVLLVPGPVPRGEGAGQDELAQRGGEEHAPVEPEQVVPLHPGGVLGLHVPGDQGFLHCSEREGNRLNSHCEDALHLGAGGAVVLELLDVALVLDDEGLVGAGVDAVGAGGGAGVSAMGILDL